jgi:Domain of unknown function (DUF4177)
MKKFEYKTIKTEHEGFWNPKLNFESIEAKLNSLGSEGWELVSCIESNMHQGLSNEVYFFMKREIG